jgi:hypothetical protein
MVTEDDLNYYYDVVETLWLGGTNPTLEAIRLRIRPTEHDKSHLIEGLAALISRKWLKVEQIPVSAWDPQTVYETWYVPIRDHGLDNK